MSIEKKLATAMVVVSILGFFLIIIGLFFTGCHQESPAVATTTIQSPVQALTGAVTKTNWLMVVALGMFVWGVMSIFNGNTKGGMFIAGALALAGGIAALAIGNELIIAWLPVIKWVVPPGAAAAFSLWAYNHYVRSQKISTLKFVTDYLDKDKDGKVTAADIKAVLGIAI